MLKAASEAFGVPVSGAWTGIGGRFYLQIGDRAVSIGSAEQLLGQRRVRVRLCEEGIAVVMPIKRDVWFGIVKEICHHAKPLVAASTPQDRLPSIDVVEPKTLDQVMRARRDRQCHVWQGELFVFASDRIEPFLLKEGGFKRRTVSVKDHGRKTSRSAWVKPA